MIRDLRHGIRSFARTPLFAVTAIVTVALGVGANTAVFSFVSALLLRPLPFSEPERLVRIDSVRGNEIGKLTPREWEELDRDTDLFEGVAAWYPSQYNVTGAGTPEVLTACMTTANLFRVLGVNLVHGSSWEEGTHRDRNPVVVLNHEVWRRRFGGDPSIVGRTLPLDFSSYEVTGIAAPGFDFPGSMDIFRAAYLGSAQNWDVRSLFVVARLRPGVSLDHARQRLALFGDQMKRDYPKTNEGIGFDVRTLRDAYVGEVRPYLLLTLALAGLVLVVACGNVANLLLSRGLARRKELAVRTALGAPRSRLVRQFLAEAGVLAAAGGAVGAGLAYWWIGLMRTWFRVELPSWMTVELDGRVLLFALMATLAAGVAAGVFPAFLLSGTSVEAALRESSRGSSGGRGSARVRNALVAGELALAVTLLVFAGLLLKSFWALQHTGPGFELGPALTFRTDPPWARYNQVEQTAPFYRRALEELSAIPGVTAVAANHSLPLALNQNYGKPTIVVEGQGADEQLHNPFVNVQIVSPNYLQAMGIPLREGRTFHDDDRPHTVPVAVLSRPLARRLFDDASPLGRRVQLPGQLSALNESNASWLQVVGVAEGVRSESLTEEPSLDIYLSNQQHFAGDTYFVLRTSQSPASLSAAVSRAIQRVDPEQPVFDIRPLEQRIYDTVWQRRMAGSLGFCFGALALSLAAIGAYGVLSHVVSQRTREIGIRQALGSSPGGVWWMVVKQGLAPALVGLAVGIAASLIAGRLSSRFRYGVSGHDAAVYAVVALAVVAVSIVACALPAWRASRVSPNVALTSE